MFASAIIIRFRPYPIPNWNCIGQCVYRGNITAIIMAAGKKCTIAPYAILVAIVVQMSRTERCSLVKVLCPQTNRTIEKFPRRSDGPNSEVANSRMN